MALNPITYTEKIVSSFLKYQVTAYLFAGGRLHDLQQKIDACGGDRNKGIEALLIQNNDEGWMRPEALRLSRQELR
ncbi:MAG: hypothetical protein SYC29_04915 [Planctomycetota bacterium]|nr:hypothetical protein [Planctomycetota bacterium]